MIKKLCLTILALLIFTSTIQAQGSGVATVQFFIDGIVCSPVITMPTVSGGTVYDSLCDWSTIPSIKDGNHVLTAKATDKAGNVGISMGRTILVDNTIPTITINTPLPGALVGGNRVTISAAAADAAGPIAKLELKIDGQVRQTVTNTDSLNYSWNSNPSKRTSPLIEIKATDKAGRTATKTIQVRVQ